MDDQFNVFCWIPKSPKILGSPLTQTKSVFQIRISPITTICSPFIKLKIKSDQFFCKTSIDTLLFFVESVLLENNIQLSTKFLFFPEIAHDTQSSQVCRVIGVLYKASVSCHSGSALVGGGFKSRYRPYISCIFKNSLKRSFFSTTKTKVFLTDVYGFMAKEPFFLKNYIFCDVTELNSFFQLFFQI